MGGSVPTISFSALAWSFLPVAAVVAILFRWTSNAGTAVYAIARMLIQLLLIGYVLVFIFEAEHGGLIVAVLTVMLVAASAIAMRPLKNRRAHLYGFTLLAILIGGGLTLALVTQLVLTIEPWFLPRYMVPLAGMVFASSMNAVSLAAERYESELALDGDHARSRSVALNTAMIPLINSLIAVGLVSLPGMMTGQILSGVSPSVAARYQIVVMCMIFGASGISAAIYLFLISSATQTRRQESHAPAGD